MENKELKNRIENIVKNEVLTCQSSLVEMLLQNEIVSYDDVVNMYVDNSDKIEELTNEKEEIEEDDTYLELDSKYMNDELSEDEEVKYNGMQQKIEELENKISDLESEQEDPQEVMEWWVVTDWMADQLEAQGEPILRSDYETWWGRTCSGQSIELDGVIANIAK